MERLRLRLQAAERATRIAEDALTAARDERSRISAELDDCEDKLRAAGAHRHRGRTYNNLRERCDDLEDSLLNARARVHRALEAHTESQEWLHQLIDAENRATFRSSRHEEEEREAHTSSRRPHRPTAMPRDDHRTSSEGYSNRSRNDRSYSSHSYGTDSGYDSRNDRQASQDARERRRNRASRNYYQPSPPQYDDGEGYSTEERIPRSEQRQYDHHPPEAEPRHHHEEQYGRVPRPHHRQHNEYSEYTRYTTEERGPRSEYRQYNERETDFGHRESEPDHRSGRSTPRTHNGNGEHTRRSTPRADHSHREDEPEDSSDQQKPRANKTPTSFPSQRTVDDWWKYVNSCFEDYSKINQFPTPPGLSCGKPDCDAKRSHRPLAACECTIRASFDMVKGLNAKRERLRWHPDRFAVCKASLQEDFKKMASEVFTVLDNMHKEKE